MDIKQIKERLSQLQKTTSNANSFWKPSPGKTQIRLVPYKFNKDNPFIQLYFQSHRFFIKSERKLIFQKYRILLKLDLKSKIIQSGNPYLLNNNRIKKTQFDYERT